MKLFIKIVAVCVLASASFLLMKSDSHALSPVFPDAQQSNTWAATALPGGGTALNANVADFKVYSNSASFSILLRDICRNFTHLYPGGGINYPVSEQVTIYAVNPTTEIFIASTARSYSTASNCSGNNMSITVPSGYASRTQKRGDYNGYAVWVRVARTIPQINGFTVEVSPGAGSYATFAEVIPSLATSRTAPAYASFALLDRQFYPPNEIDYNLQFAPDCDVTSNQTVYLKWEDADLGNTNETSPLLSFTLRNLTTGADMPLTVYGPSGGAIGTTSTTVSGAAKLGGPNEYRAAAFTIQPNHRYEWRWRDADGNNGIQIWMPYNQINTIVNCNQRPIISGNANCTRVWGTARDPDAATQVRVRIRLVGNAWQTINIDNTVGNNGSPYPNAYSWNIPNAYKSAFANTEVAWVEVRDTGPSPGSPLWVRHNINFSARCGTAWDYDPFIEKNSIDNATQPKPGDTITVRTRLRNVGDGTGPAGNYTVRATVASRPYVNPDTRSVSFAARAPGVYSAWTNSTFSIQNNVPHGFNLCFEMVINPESGQATPTLTGSGTDIGGPVCYSVYNERFNMDELVLETVGGSEIFPGDRTEFTYNFNNTGDPEEGGYTGAAHGIAPNIVGNISVTRGSATIHTGGSSTQTIGAGAVGTAQYFEATATGQPGDDVCFTLTVTPDRGFSDPADRQPVGNEVLEECFNLGEAPYLEVLGADVWAGGEFAPGPTFSGGSWCPFIPPTTSSDAYIQSVRRVIPGSGNVVGSSVEYGATAMHDIVNFVTTSVFEDSRLHFSNTPSSGHLNSDGKCVTDYYNYLSRDAADGVQNAGASGIPGGSGQFFRNGDWTLNSNVNNLGTRQVVLIVNGDVTINGNISYGNYSANGPGQIPFFMLVANGDINISEDVDTLDGVYVSQGSNGIDTCYDGGNGAGQLRLDQCNDQLTIHGMFIAREIEFRRTHSGVVRNAADQARQGAELFDFSPELFLAQPRLISTYERSLPASQVKDLPPIY